MSYRLYDTLCSNSDCGKSIETEERLLDLNRVNEHCTICGCPVKIVPGMRLGKVLNGTPKYHTKE